MRGALSEAAKATERREAGATGRGNE